MSLRYLDRIREKKINFCRLLVKHCSAVKAAPSDAKKYEKGSPVLPYCACGKVDRTCNGSNFPRNENAAKLAGSHFALYGDPHSGPKWAFWEFPLTQTWLTLDKQAHCICLFAFVCKLRRVARQKKHAVDFCQLFG